MATKTDELPRDPGQRPFSQYNDLLKLAGNVLLGAWIASATLFFVVRFSLIFYESNRSGILELIHKLHH